MRWANSPCQDLGARPKYLTAVKDFFEPRLPNVVDGRD
ncbi:hypothetical protein USDA257_p00920 (plasmid) [Sinorhizobium fredii USDA 257]|uniref:Uncharacterized protein n=1 Tax=Sinorhizobium fredii (strain USDA 257) TaxID=1185652 RepID=I3XG04_SINF2|nr:hypothetical protein USDA257_p00920 [Sinorhizobium fredii USDA 257]